MLYGDPDATASEEDVAGVWSNGYEAVYHLREVPTGAADEIKDSAKSRDGTAQGSPLPTQTTGPGHTGSAIVFDDDDDQYILCPDFAPGIDAMTAEAWVYHVAGGDTDDRVVAKSSSGSSGHASYIYSLGLSGTTLRVRIHTGGTGESDDCGTSVSYNTWTHIAFTYDDADNTIRYYIDGDPEGTDPDSGGTIDTYANPVTIADNSPVEHRLYTGVLDEVRISSVARSAGWMETQHNNMDDPSSFFTLGAEE